MFGLNLEERLIMNPNGAVINGLPLDVQGQLEFEENVL
jgi:hypothetical protein